MLLVSHPDVTITLLKNWSGCKKNWMNFTPGIIPFRGEQVS
jgi:hypothetical protein